MQAANTGNACWLSASSESMLVGGAPVSRCGVCLSVVGPTLRPFRCSVVGYFTINTTAIPENALRSMLVIERTAFRYIVGTTESRVSSISQATVSETGCALQVPLAVHARADGDALALFFFNHNAPVAALDVGRTTYAADAHGVFRVPRDETAALVRARSLSGQSLSRRLALTPGTHLFQDNFRALNDNPACEFTPMNILYIADENRPTHDFYMWHPFIKEETIARLVATDASIHIEPTRPAFVVFFVHNILMPLTQLFATVEITASSPAPVRFGEARLRAVLVKWSTPTPAEMEASTLTCELGTGIAFTTFSTARNKNVTKAKYSLHPRCSEYANGIAIDVTAAAPVDVTFAFLDPRVERNAVCRYTSFDCLNTSCTFTGDHTAGASPWEDGCAPVCGVCPIGRTCAPSGMCVDDVEINLRSAAAAAGALAALLVLLVL